MNNQQEFDIIFEHVLMFDGVAEHQGCVCDVGVCNRRISDIGDLKHLSSKQRIDCSNLCMIPGMIDVHTHADLVIFDPNSISSSIDYLNPYNYTYGI